MQIKSIWTEFSIEKSVLSFRFFGYVYESISDEMTRIAKKRDILRIEKKGLILLFKQIRLNISIDYLPSLLLATYFLNGMFVLQKKEMSHHFIFVDETVNRKDVPQFYIVRWRQSNKIKWAENEHLVGIVIVVYFNIIIIIQYLAGTMHHLCLF